MSHGNIVAKGFVAAR